MQKPIIVLCGLCLVLGFVGVANAIPFSDLDSINQVITATSSYSGTFNIATGDGGAGDIWGYDPSLYEITSAQVDFTFKGSSSKVYILQVAIADWNGGYGASGTGNSGGGKIFDEALNPGVWADLSEDGILSYAVSIFTSGTTYATSFTLLSAKLTVEATEKPQQPVPEPATMLLLGTGLVGLAAAGRRKFSRK